MSEETPEERAARRKRLQFLCNSKDHDAVKCRLFLTGFITDRARKPEIIDLFSPFGRVYDVAIHPGYIFVQYDNMESSLKAIAKLDKKPFKGGFIQVKLAEKGKKAEIASAEICRYYSFGKCNRGNDCHFRHEDPKRPGRPESSGSDHHKDERERNRSRERIMTERRSRERDLPPSRAFIPEPAPDHLRESTKRPVPDDFDDYPRHRRDPHADRMPLPGYNAPPLHAPAVAAAPLRREPAASADLRPPFDCVIIAGSQPLRAYCEMIERKLVEFGMLTSVQLVDGDHLLKLAVEEAAKRTVPYTICVTANNEEHRSLTLNILHGVAQEHRNMPLEDAIPFLSRDFDHFVEMMKKKIATMNAWVPPDEKVRYLLNLLLDGRHLTIPELEDVNKYISLALGKLKEVNKSEAKPDKSNVQSQSMDRNGDDLLAKLGFSRGREDREESHGRGSLLPPPKSDTSSSSIKPSGTMQDLLRLGGLQTTGMFEQRGYGGRASASSSSGLNFDDPGVKRALNDILKNSSISGHGFPY